MALTFLNVPVYGEDNPSGNTQKLLLDSITVTGKSVAGYNTMNAPCAPLNAVFSVSAKF